MRRPGRDATRSRRIRKSAGFARQPDTVRSWTRSATRTPPAPGSARRNWPAATPSSRAFEVVLERVARGRPERSIVLTGLRGVGKTVLLNAMRSAAVRRGWGTGKLEARPDQSLRRPLAAALHLAIRELARAGLGEPACPRRAQVIRAMRKDPVDGDDRWTAGQVQTGAATGWQPGIDVPAVARPGRLRRHRDRPGRAVHRRRRAGRRPGRGVALFIDEMQDLGRTTCRRCAPRATSCRSSGCRWSSSAPGCRTCRPCCRRPSPTRSGCSAIARIDRLDRAAADARAARCRPAKRAPTSTTTRSTRCTQPPAATRTSSRPTARPRGTSRRARRSRAADVAVAAPEAEAELAVGFFGSRFERATPAEREYLRAMADLAVADESDDVGPTAAVAEAAGPHAAVAVARPGRAAEEGTGLLRRSADGSPSPSRTSAATCNSRTRKRSQSGSFGSVGSRERGRPIFPMTMATTVTR